MRGRHTTDEFLTPVWREFAIKTLKSWNGRRVQKLTDDVLEGFARTWVEGRINRARRFMKSGSTVDINVGAYDIATVP